MVYLLYAVQRLSRITNDRKPLELIVPEQVRVGIAQDQPSRSNRAPVILRNGKRQRNDGAPEQYWGRLGTSLYKRQRKRVPQPTRAGAGSLTERQPAEV
jgi:hypothetical protein